jgi:branched-chain amino acid transport system ATP-binding protein
MLNGQIRPDSGSILLEGRPLVGMTPREIWRLGVGRTFQITSTFASMTVLENVQTTLLSRYRRALGVRRLVRDLYVDEAMALLERVGMADQAQRPCSFLAYGDLKRVDLAIALGNQPRLLLMDEPTAGMAPRERVALMELTAGIVRERGISVLFTEHDMDVVFAHAEQLIVLNRGRLIAEGAPDDVRDDAEVRQVYLGAGTTFAG